MDRSSVSLELRLIKEKITKRVSIAEKLTSSAWDPKLVEIPPGERFLVIAPHPDDDVIGCGGTLLKVVSMRKAVRICYLSLPSLDSPSKEERIAEVQRSLKVVGVSEYSMNQQEFPASIKGVVDLIAPELEKWNPDCVLVPSPLENQSHHLMAFEGYIEALRASKCQAATGLYEVWGLVVPNMTVDITSQMDQKLKSIAAHASQVKVTDYVRMAMALNEYRAISSKSKGYAEAFLYLEKHDLLNMFP
jgi:LmbE family N-acetylglucosaminyl deacetylase